MVQVLVEVLGAKGKPHHGFPGDELGPAVVDDPRLHQGHDGVRHDLCVAAQVVLRGEAVPHRIGHPADAQLDAGPVGDLVQEEPGHGLGLPVGLHGAAGDGLLLLVGPHHVLGLGDVDLGPLPGDVGGEAVDLQDDVVRLLLDEGVHAHPGGSEAHVPLLVGEGDVKEGDVRVKGLPAPLVHLAQVEGGEVRPALLPGSALLIAHEVGADVKGPRVGAVQEGHGGDDVRAADGDPLQLLRPGGDGVGNGPGIAGAAADVHPLATLDQGGCLLLGEGFLPELLF